jgi:hypothetical protein
VAGTGTSSYSGDNGVATSATLNYPYGVAFDASSNLYIADGNNNVVRKVSSGVITTVAGQYSVGDGASATGAACSVLLLPQLLVQPERAMTERANMGRALKFI